jgi:hypothetical protein
MYMKRLYLDAPHSGYNDFSAYVSVVSRSHSNRCGLFINCQH